MLGIRSQCGVQYRKPKRQVQTVADAASVGSKEGELSDAGSVGNQHYFGVAKSCGDHQSLTADTLGRAPVLAGITAD